MIHAALLGCTIASVNCAFAAAGLAAARRCGIPLGLTRGAGAGVLVAGTFVECVVAAFAPGRSSVPMLILAGGAAVAGAACDAACGYVFDAVTLPCLLLMTLVAVLEHSAAAFALGAGAAGGCLAALYAATRGRGLGLGDVKLACCIGGAAGAAPGLQAIGIAFVLGGAYAGYVLATGRAGRADEMRFAPYLAAGFAAAAIHGAIR